MSVDCMLIFILSVLDEALEMSCAEAAEALPSRSWNLQPNDLLTSDVRS